jgi:hypothetical protein
MNSKWHAYVSFAKSGIRMVSCIGAICLMDTQKALLILASGLLIAECLGIIEEIKDER